MTDDEEKYARKVGLKVEQRYIMRTGVIKKKWYQLFKVPEYYEHRVDLDYDLYAWNGDEWLRVPVEDVNVSSPK